uniref:Uncharacterized protein n=1 Tax=Malus domestica TaxID=3750 RepID=A7M6H6_MALDO|nr:hypothetical protein [Malus domestica]
MMRLSQTMRLPLTSRSMSLSPLSLRSTLTRRQSSTLTPQAALSLVVLMVMQVLLDARLLLTLMVDGEPMVEVLSLERTQPRSTGVAPTL